VSRITTTTRSSSWNELCVVVKRTPYLSISLHSVSRITITTTTRHDRRRETNSVSSWNELSVSRCRFTIDLCRVTTRPLCVVTRHDTTRHDTTWHDTTSTKSSSSFHVDRSTKSICVSWNDHSVSSWNELCVVKRHDTTRYDVSRRRRYTLCRFTTRHVDRLSRRRSVSRFTQCRFTTRPLSVSRWIDLCRFTTRSLSVVSRHDMTRSRHDTTTSSWMQQRRLIW